MEGNQVMNLETDCDGDSSSSEDSDRMFIHAASPSVATPEYHENSGLSSKFSSPTKISTSKFGSGSPTLCTTSLEAKADMDLEDDAGNANEIQSRVTRRSQKLKVLNKEQIGLLGKIMKEKSTEEINPGNSISLTERKPSQKRNVVNTSPSPVKTKRRRTIAYRNSRMNKSKGNVRNRQQVVRKQLRLEPVEPEIYLDAEIDRVLEEKAIKNNLTATNVKSIIRQVITNNMVQKMMMSALKKERRLAVGQPSAGKDGNCSGGDDDDDDGLDFEPKLTRAKTKELFQSQIVPPIWSPIKLMKPQIPSETHILITSHDLPEDSECEDEEYIPTEKDLQIQSEDESGLTPVTSEQGSPMTPRPEYSPAFSPIQYPVKKRSLLRETVDSVIQKPIVCPDDATLFKTPPPPPWKERRLDCGIGLRTRSRLPLNDTPLEDLEMQLIPPDITRDMYDFGKVESENEDYLDFLKGFASRGRSTVTEGNEDEEEADPEYNVMEDEEDHNDKEEHRDDRAVKVTKKELNELIAELFDDFDDCHFSSGEEFEDFSTLKQQQPFASANSGGNDPLAPLENLAQQEVSKFPFITSSSSVDTTTVNNGFLTTLPTSSKIDGDFVSLSGTRNEEEPLHDPKLPSAKVTNDVTDSPNGKMEYLFSRDVYGVLLFQMTQHVQLLSQSYLFYTSRPDQDSKKVAETAHSMIMNLWNMSSMCGPTSTYSVCNLELAVKLITNYTRRKQSSSPIKKKILENIYFNKLLDHSLLNLPGWVTQTICESSVFMHGSLLPADFPDLETEDGRPCYFTPGEDALIASSLSNLSETDSHLNFKDKAAIIAKALLVIRTSRQVYTRIRNVRSNAAKSVENINNPLEFYFRHKKLQPCTPVSGTGAILKPLPPSQQSREKLPKTWIEILNFLETKRENPCILQNYKPPPPPKITQRIKPYPSRKRRPKLCLRSSDKTEKVQQIIPVSVVSPMRRNVSNEKSSPPSKNKIRIRSVVENPKLAGDISGVDEESATIPICNYRGEPELYYIVPRKEMSEESHSKYTKENTRIPLVPLNILDASEKLVMKKNKPLSSAEHIQAVRARVPVIRQPRKPDLMRNLSSSSGEESDTDDERNRFLLSDYMSEGDSATEDESDDSIRDGKSSNRPILVDLASGDETVLAPSHENDGQSQNNSGNQRKQSSGDGDGNQGNEGNEGGGGREYGESHASTGGQSTSSGAGDGDGDEDRDKKEKRLDSGAGKGSGSSKKNDETEDEPDKIQKLEEGTTMPNPPKTCTQVGKSSSSFSESTGRRVSSTSKKIKKNQLPSGKISGKRASRYNTGSAEDLLELEVHGDGGECSGGGEVKDAYFDTLCQRVQHHVDPAVFNIFIQTLSDFDSSGKSGKDLFLLIEDILKVHPDLVKQFVFIMTSEEAVEIGRFIDFQNCQNEIRFMEFLEKWTSDCPQLKSRIIQKYATLREEDNLTEVMEPFFAQNPAMLEAFKALFSSIYRLRSSSGDFESIDLEMEDPSEEPNYETVKLPEETEIPATHSCSCSCHENTSNIPFHARIKHCTKCCLKFQDGKVYVHNGRIMKPVNIEFTTPEVGQEILVGSTCISCLKPKASPTPSSLPKSAVEDVEVKLYPSPSSSTNINSSSTNKNTTSIAEEETQPPLSSKPWTREEDFIMLTVYQSEQNITAAIERLSRFELPQRTSDEIHARFMELTNILQQMTERGSPKSPN